MPQISEITHLNLLAFFLFNLLLYPLALCMEVQLHTPMDAAILLPSSCFLFIFLFIVSLYFHNASRDNGEKVCLFLPIYTDMFQGFRHQLKTFLPISKSCYLHFVFKPRILPSPGSKWWRDEIFMFLSFSRNWHVMLEV